MDKSKLTFDGNEYSIEDLSEGAKQQVLNIQFVDERIQQINNELAIADTARIGYSHAIKNEVSKIDSQN